MRNSRPNNVGGLCHWSGIGAGIAISEALMFLSRDAIRVHAEKGQLIDCGYNPDCLRQSSYDLRLGPQVYIAGTNAPQNLTEQKPYLTLTPGQFAILTCYERLNLRDTGEQKYMAFISLRSKFKFQGLVNISGFHVDPTHRGTLLFAVQNVGPSDILLKYNQPTFTIFFAEVTEGIGNGRKDPLEGIRLEDVQNLGGGSVTISELRKEIVELRRIVLVYGPIVVAALIALFANLVRIWSSSPAPPATHP